MYESYYKLRGSPFLAVPEPGVFFRNDAREEVLAWLERGLPGGAAVALVTGAKGVGKTALAQQLLAEAEDAPVVARTLETPSAADSLIRAVAPLFGLMPRGAPEQLWQEFETFLESRAQGGGRLFLLIDDVQELPPLAWDELGRIAALRRGTRVPLTCVLFGANESRARAGALAGSGLVERRLEPLDTEGVRSYVQYRLRSAGWAGDPQLEPELFEEIAQRTEGLPRQINSLCDRLLTWASLEGRHRLNADDVARMYDRSHGKRTPAARAVAGIGGGVAPLLYAEEDAATGMASPSPRASVRTQGARHAADRQANRMPPPRSSQRAPAPASSAPAVRPVEVPPMPEPRKSMDEDLAEIERLAAQLEKIERVAPKARPAPKAGGDIESLRPSREQRRPAAAEEHPGPHPEMPAWPDIAYERPVPVVEHRRTGIGWFTVGLLSAVVIATGAAVYGGWIPFG
ncbi:AAA family ATPase [Ectothiorhodospiraceae bacterium 2226]|nr:AAA family ATPase [Ectothiorhodospiraceae bacterium 2226]